jgi:hypothetical protein
MCQLVGERVKQVVVASDRLAYFNAIENPTRQHFEQYNWELPTDCALPITQPWLFC